MAQYAFGRNCSKCQTLVTFSGNWTDEEFNAQCPCCGSSETAGNPSGSRGLAVHNSAAIAESAAAPDPEPDPAAETAPEPETESAPEEVPDGEVRPA